MRKLKNRPYSQDFSGPSMTDTSFGPACDINTIVKHYAIDGLDPNPERKKLERFGEATTLTYAEAMRQKAEIDSAFENLPDSERAQHNNSVEAWLRHVPETTELEGSPEPAPETPPEGATEPKSEAKVE